MFKVPLCLLYAFEFWCCLSQAKQHSPDGPTPTDAAPTLTASTSVSSEVMADPKDVATLEVSAGKPYLVSHHASMHRPTQYATACSNHVRYDHMGSHAIAHYNSSDHADDESWMCWEKDHRPVVLECHGVPCIRAYPYCLA